MAAAVSVTTPAEQAGIARPRRIRRWSPAALALLTYVAIQCLLAASVLLAVVGWQVAGLALNA